MMKGFLWLCLVSVVFVTASAKKGAKKNVVCTHNNISPQKCNPAKAGGWCIPRVEGVTYNQYDVMPSSFLVTWKAVSSAKCYFIEVMTGHTSFVFKTHSCVKGTRFRVSGLKPWKFYGVRISAVNRRCKRGQPSDPILRIKTYWSPAVVVTTPTPRPTYTPKVGACGRNFFTCASKKRQCVPKRKYCNDVLDCRDGSDERRCPGGCKEIDVDFKNGNYSCSRWGSPGSFCFFDCKDGYVRDGSRFTLCSKRAKVWTNPLPTCRLYRTKTFRVLQEETTSSTEVGVEWEPVEHAAMYAVQAVQQGGDDGDEHATVNRAINATDCCTTTMNGLNPGAEYRLSIFAIDADGLRGEESLPVFYRTGLPAGLKKQGK